MKVTITIDCDNAAFESEPQNEVARILRTAALNLKELGIMPVDAPLVMWDYNGNRVGKLEVS